MSANSTVAGTCFAGEDFNGDNVTSGAETDPRVPDIDTDLDGLTDAAEVLIGTLVNDPDTDNDGLCDGGGSVNGVCLGGDRILSTAESKDLNERLRALGLTVYDPELSSFTLGGGGAHCLMQAIRRERVAGNIPCPRAEMSMCYVSRPAPRSISEAE